MQSRPDPRAVLVVGVIGALLVAAAYTAVQRRSAGATGRYDVAGENTEKMAGVLRTINAEAQAHPMDYYHLNHERAAHLRARLDSLGQQAAPREWRQLRYRYARELLYAGETKRAIQTLSTTLDSVADRGSSPSRVTPTTKPLIDLLAVAYLRLGEQQNCIDDHTAASCILPIAGAGVHTRPAGSRSAIALYEKILHRLPRDHQSRWLLNIAYMTLGEYPEGVPSAWRIGGLDDSSASGLGTFRDVAPALGVDHNGLSGGTSVEDFDNDGFLDILTTSYGMDDGMKLYLNDGSGGFEDHTEEAGLSGLVSGLNTVHADYNNDGFEDVFVLRGAWLGAAGEHPNSLLKNNGDGTFTDVTYQAGLASYHPTQTAAWGDYNSDGWIDLFVGNESSAQVNLLTGKKSQEATVRPSALYRNNGDGTFTNVASRVGLDVEAYVKGTAWGNVNNDGRPDLFVSVLGGKNQLYINQGGASAESWTFEERASQAGVDEPVFSFPTWFWDYNNDGHQDLFVGGYDVRHLDAVAHAAAEEFIKGDHAALTNRVEKPRAYRNDGDGTFTDVTKQLDLDRSLFAMGSNYGDLDNDGFLDFYVGTGAPPFTSIVPNRMFRNQQGEYFEDVSFGGGFAHIQKGHAVGFGDFDNDGDQDVYSVIGGAVEGDNFQNVLFENPGHGHAWITLDLEGRSANRSAIGVRLRLVVSDSAGARRTIHRTVSTGGSFGASSLQQEIGLGAAARIDTLRVTWSNRERTTDTFTDVAVNQHLKIIEGQPPEPVSRSPVSFASSPNTPPKSQKR